MHVCKLRLVYAPINVMPLSMLCPTHLQYGEGWVFDLTAIVFPTLGLNVVVKSLVSPNMLKWGEEGFLLCTTISHAARIYQNFTIKGQDFTTLLSGPSFASNPMVLPLIGALAFPKHTTAQSYFSVVFLVIISFLATTIFVSVFQLIANYVVN